MKRKRNKDERLERGREEKRREEKNRLNVLRVFEGKVNVTP